MTDKIQIDRNRINILRQTYDRKIENRGSRDEPEKIDFGRLFVFAELAPKISSSPFTRSDRVPTLQVAPLQLKTTARNFRVVVK